MSDDQDKQSHKENETQDFADPPLEGAPRVQSIDNPPASSDSSPMYLPWEVTYPSNMIIVGTSFYVRFRIPEIPGIGISKNIPIIVKKAGVEISKQWEYVTWGRWYDVPVGIAEYGEVEISAETTEIGGDIYPGFKYKLWVSPHPVIESFLSNGEFKGAGSHGTLIRITSRQGDIWSEEFYAINRKWEVKLLPEVKSGSINPLFHENKPRYTGRQFSPGNLVYLGAPKISHPGPGEVLALLDWRVEVKGTNAAPGYRIQVTNQLGAVYGLSEPAGADGVWSLWINLPQAFGPYGITARHPESGDLAWAEQRNFILSKLTITEPRSGATVDMQFPISGTGGAAEYPVEVYRAFSTTYKIGEGPVGANSNWTLTSFFQSMIPGPFTMTPRQVFNGVPVLGTAITVNVRPPKVDLQEASATDNGTVTIKGTGYVNGTGDVVAELYILFNGLNTQGPFPITTTPWTKTFSDILPGTYIVTAVQRVLGLDGHYIPNDSNERSLTVNVPPPTLGYRIAEPQKPEFFGTGKNWSGYTSEVEVWIVESGAPIVPVVEVKNGTWTSKAEALWAPGRYRLTAMQSVNKQYSSWVTEISVVIPSSPPILDPIKDNGFSPVFSGTCWPGATLHLQFSGSDQTYPVTDTNIDGRWEYTHTFLPGRHIVTVTQTFGGQTSGQVTDRFDIGLPRPVITWPVNNEQVDYRVAVQGCGGHVGSMMKIVDRTTEKTLGEARVGKSAEWTVWLEDLEFARYTFYAQATFDTVQSDPSDNVTVEVVLMPPHIDLQPTDKVPRTFRIEGRARPSTQDFSTEIELWINGTALQRLRVTFTGYWSYQSTLPLGHYKVKAKQFYGERESEFGIDHEIDVVPASPVIETPALDEPVGRQVAFAGFGYVGDTVTIAFAHALDVILGSAVVQRDGTWWFWATLDESGGEHVLMAQQSFGEFHSAWSAARPFVLLTDPPTFTQPEQGEWVPPLPTFEGTGEQGAAVQLCAWYNPDELLVRDVPVNNGRWETPPGDSLRNGACWVRALQEMADGRLSDVAESRRFEVSSDDDRTEGQTS